MIRCPITKSLTVLFFSLALLQLEARHLSNSKEIIREHASETPYRYERDASRLSEYLCSPWDEEWKQAYALYYWIATNIDYELDLARNPGTFNDPSELVDYALRKQSGVCQHYAELFHFMGREAGLQTLVIPGYTKQGDEVYDVPHAWNAIKLDDNWYLIDATWASGYIEGERVEKRFTDDYFLVSPTQMIKTHMPFDPVFQMLKEPLTHEDFYRNNFSDPNFGKIDFKDEIEKYQELDEPEKLRQSIKRIEKAGIINDMILREANHRVENLNIMMKNRQVDVHNRAVELFNLAVRDFNAYLQAKQNRFKKPRMSDQEIAGIISEVEENALESKSLFELVRPTEEMVKTMSQNAENLRQLLRQLEEEKAFVQKYLNTGKMLRPLLF